MLNYRLVMSMIDLNRNCWVNLASLANSGKIGFTHLLVDTDSYIYEVQDS